VRFAGYIPAVVRGMKIEWDVEVQITDDVARALHPQDPSILRVGRLRRPFHVKPVRAGGRGKSFVREEIIHPRGALVFATADDSWFFVEVPGDVTATHDT